MYYINYSSLSKMINGIYTFIIILKRIILLSRKIVILNTIKTTRLTGSLLFGYKPLSPAASKGADLFKSHRS